MDLGIEKKILCYGVIISTNDAVVSLQGFLIGFINELFSLAVMGNENDNENDNESGLVFVLVFPVNEENAYGLVVNLYQNERMNLLIGALLLNPKIRLYEGAKVNAISRLASIILGDFAIGCILDGQGNQILNSGRIDVQYPWLGGISCFRYNS